MTGFRFVETMKGWHQFVDHHSADKYPLEFTISWGPDNLSRWLNPFGREFMTCPLKGLISIDGIGKNIPCTGSLKLAYHKGMIRYVIMFEHNGVFYKYIGKKTGIRPWNLHKNHTTCNGFINARSAFGEKRISISTVYFKLDTLVNFLRSFKFTE